MYKKINAMTAFTLLCCITTVFSQSKSSALSERRYVDPKGYFKIVPPAGWTIQEYPNDIRGKVALNGPTPNVDLRVLVNAVDFTTIDKLVDFCKSVETRTGLNTNIKSTTFEGIPAVSRTYEMQGIKFQMIDFLIGAVDHNIQFGAPVAQFQKYLPVALKSIATYEVISKDISDDDSKKHTLAKYQRLAQLMIDNGNMTVARQYVVDGLAMAPDNAMLLDLQQTLNK